jgi:hypothetical protein
MIPIRDPELHVRFRWVAALLGVSLTAGLAGCGDVPPAATPAVAATTGSAAPAPPVAKVVKGKAARVSPVQDEDTSHHLMRRNKQLKR